MTKRVTVSMPDDDAAILKEYAAFFETNQSDVLFLFARAAIHQHSLHCKKVQSILELRNKSLDKRVKKPCFGFGCLACRHSTACQTGIYKGYMEPKDECVHLVKKDAPVFELIKALGDQQAVAA